ncbi:unnamed protein product (mitochondrion) [Enteromyxum leei]|uniref:Uncharacterized protein n=1 Tax=Enteromyxum leei TaxID=188704 RepID=A0A1Q2XB11_ENTLE|nr:unnamed protein product [Enteromyxum leei]
MTPPVKGIPKMDSVPFAGIPLKVNMLSLRLVLCSFSFCSLLSNSVVIYIYCCLCR